MSARLRVVPHFSSGIVERARVKITPREKRLHAVCLAFLEWGDFHAHSRFARSTIPEDKMRDPGNEVGQVGDYS